MKIINPAKVKKVELLVGIPSYNEEKTIRKVTEIISQGLEKFFPKIPSAIANLDNCSPDGTRREFFRAKTKVPLIYLSTPANKRGKGYNLYNLFLFSRQLQASKIATFDADLNSITPIWLKFLFSPLFQGWDYVTPWYARQKIDGTITNLLCYPLVYGLLGKNIRQPIGGEFAFNKKLVNHWLKQKWTKEINQYGIDIFMTLEAIFSGAKICQARLGKKIHRSSKPHLSPMFVQVSKTLFRIVISHLSQILKIEKIYQPPILGSDLFSLPPSKELSKSDYQRMGEIFFKGITANRFLIEKVFSEEMVRKLAEMEKEKKIEIKDSLWAKIVYRILAASKDKINSSHRFYNKNSAELVDLLRIFYFGRIVSFCQKINDLDYQKFERKVSRQAKCFWKLRHYFFSLLKS